MARTRVRRMRWCGLFGTGALLTVGQLTASAQHKGYIPPPQAPCLPPPYMAPAIPQPTGTGTPTTPATPGTQTQISSTPMTAPAIEPSLSPGSGLAYGGEQVALPAVGYIDTAVPFTHVRFRYDAAFDNNRPDRAEFFYAKCGCFPGAPGPLLPEKRVDYQDWSLYLEYAVNGRFSGFFEGYIRAINPDVNPNEVGIGDINTGFKAALIACPDQFVTFQFRVFIPTGDARDGLGTNHTSLEPALLVYRQLSDKMWLSAELRDWIPIGGTDFQGNVLRYGVGVSYDVYNRCGTRVAPVAEFVGWTVLGGKEFDAIQNETFDAKGDTIINAKIGARTYFGGNNDFYVGYGRALTGEVWYKDILRVEYRRSF